MVRDGGVPTAIDIVSVQTPPTSSSTVRVNLTSRNLTSIGSGELVVIHFNRIGEGPYSFTLDLENTTLSPAAARVGLTYGAGHPDQPFILDGGQ